MSEIVSYPDLRRRLLHTVASPAQRLDYIVMVKRRLKFVRGQNPASLAIRYVPDELILDQAAVSSYMQALEKASWGSLEELAATVLEDFSNELVARWIEVGVSNLTGAGGEGAFDYAILMEDRQPNWSNPQLLSRLKGLIEE